MPLNDWKDVIAARVAADEAMPKPHVLIDHAGPNADELDLAMIGVVFQFVNALRLEIRALGVTISYAIDEAVRARF